MSLIDRSAQLAMSHILAVDLGVALAQQMMELIHRAAQTASTVPSFPPIHLTHASALAVGLSPATADALAAVTLCVWAGADRLDDCMDGDITGVQAVSTTVPAITLLTLWPAELLAGVPGGERGQALLRQQLLAMADGQHRDVSVAPQTPEDALDTALAKSGEEFALFATLPAVVAGAPADVVDSLREVGLAVGAYSQLASDLADLVHSGRDWTSGRRTLPTLLGPAPHGERAAYVEARVADGTLSEAGQWCIALAERARAGVDRLPSTARAHLQSALKPLFPET